MLGSQKNGVVRLITISKSFGTGEMAGERERTAKDDGLVRPNVVGKTKLSLSPGTLVVERLICMSARVELKAKPKEASGLKIIWVMKPPERKLENCEASKSCWLHILSRSGNVSDFATSKLPNYNNSA
jgi:hypothetical protein